MKSLIVLSLLAIILWVECNHTFLGTNVRRPLVFHKDLKYSSNMFTKRIENLNYSLPPLYHLQRTIQGILLYDLTATGASANVTQGGIGNTFVNIRMKSDRGKEIHYDLYVYA